MLAFVALFIQVRMCIDPHKDILGTFVHINSM
jgi:hypothetical protein